MADSGQDILLTYTAEVSAALAELRRFVQENQAELSRLSDTHPEIQINLAHAEEALQRLKNEAKVAVDSIDSEPITFNLKEGERQLGAIRGMLAGVSEQYATTADEIIASDERIAASERALAAVAEQKARLAAEAGASMRESYAATADAAVRAGRVEAEATGPLVEAARLARGELSELARALANSAQSAGTDLAPQVKKAEAAVRGFADAVERVRAEGGPVPPNAAAELANLERNLLVAAEAARALGGASYNAAGRVREVESAAGSASAGGLSLFARAVNRIAFSMELMIGYMVIRKIKDFAVSSLEAAEAGQKLAISLEAAAGSAKAGAEAEVFLRAEGLRLGFVVNSVAESYAKLTATARQANVPLDDQRAIFSRIMEVGASLRLSTAETNKVLEGFAQIMDRDAISTQQLRQMLRQLPAEMSNLRAVTGLTQQQLDTMTKGGQIGASVLLPLVTRLAEEVGGGFKSALTSAGAEQARLTDEWQKASAAVGDQLNPALANLRSELGRLISTESGEKSGVGELLAAITSGIEKLVQQAHIAYLSFKRDQAAEFGTAVELEAAERRLAEAQVTASERAAQHAAELHKEAAAAGEAQQALLAHADRLIASGRISRAEAAALVKDLDAELLGAREYDAADRASMQGRLDRMQQVADALRRYTIDLTAQLSQQIDATRRYASEFEDELHRTGSVSAAAADRIVAEIKKELVAIAQLPAAERAAFSERVAILTALQGEFERFTTAYEKLHERQEKRAEATAKREAAIFHEREKALASYLETVSKLIDKGTDKGTGSKGLEDDLAKKKAELKAISDKPLNTVDELNQMDQLQREINKAADALRRFKESGQQQADAAVAGISKQAQGYDVLREKMVAALTTDKFVADFNKMDRASQDAFQRLTEGFLQSAKDGTVSDEVMRRYVADVSALFTAAGIAASDFLPRLRAVTDSSRNLAQVFDAVRAGGTSGAAGLTAAAAGADKLTTSLASASAAERLYVDLVTRGFTADQAAAAVKKQLGVATAGATVAEKLYTEAIARGMNAEQAAAAVRQQLAAATDRLRASEAGATAATTSGTAATTAATTADAAAGERSIWVKGAFGELAKTKKEEGEAWTVTGKATSEATKPLLDAVIAENNLSAGLQVVNQRQKDGTERAVIFGTKTKEVTTAVADQNSKVAQAIPLLKAHGDGLKADADQAGRVAPALDKASTAMRSQATAADAAGSATGRIATATSAAVPPLKIEADLFDRIASSGVGDELDHMAAANQSVVTTVGEIVPALDRESAALGKLIARLGQLTAARDTDAKSLHAWINLELEAAVACKALTACLGDQANV